MFFDPRDKPPKSGWRQRLYVLLFETESSEAQFFDIVLLLAIAASVLVAMLETVKDVAHDYGQLLAAVEWVLTIAFTLEYCLRVVVVRRPWRFVLSPLGLIDLASVLPSYIGLLIHGDPFSLQLLRVLRLFRVFRVLHLGPFVHAGHQLRLALAASRPKIVVFTAAVVILALVQGTLIYYLEGGGESEVFTSIPRSVYWAVVTMTTVGYGDMVPQTVAGKFVSTLLMLIGYGIIAVPTGIVTAELTRRGIADAEGASDPQVAPQPAADVAEVDPTLNPTELLTEAREANPAAVAHCPACSAVESDRAANFCRYCGEELSKQSALSAQVEKDGAGGPE